MEIKNISPEKLTELKTKIDNMYQLYKVDSSGKITNEFDYEKCFRITSYTLGRFYTEINSLIWRERMVLAEMETQQAQNRKLGLETIIFETKYRLENVKDKEIFINGGDIVSRQEEQIRKCKSMIEFLQNSLNQAAYFSSNVKTLLEIKKQERDFAGDR